MTDRSAEPLREIAPQPTFRTIDGVSIRFMESDPRNVDALLLLICALPVRERRLRRRYQSGGFSIVERGQAIQGQGRGKVSWGRAKHRRESQRLLRNLDVRRGFAPDLSQSYHKTARYLRHAQ